MSARFDAVVIGGGPAGSIAATLLARAGRRVLLAERSSIGRDKTCGHCLDGRIMPLARRLGVDGAIDAATVGRFAGLRVHAPGAAMIETPLTPAGVVADRRLLDAALVEVACAAGCEVVGAAARLRSAVGPPWTVEVVYATASVDRQSTTTVVEADLVIGADGVGSGVARALGWADSRAGRGFGFSGDLDPGAMTLVSAGTIAMHVVVDGYLGTVRRDDGLVHVGALVRADASSRAPAAFVESVAGAIPELAGLAAASPQTPWRAIGPLPWRARRIASAGAALVGDAAGYGEPFTGEGMAWAIESAALLADVVVARGRFDDRGAATYRARWRASIGRAQRRCALLTRFATRPGVLRTVGRIAPGLPRIVAARMVAA